MIQRPPENINRNVRSTLKPYLFLGGSIEMGTADDWQEITGKDLEPLYNILNPRRKDWDSSWSQEFTNPNFYQQVNWELNALNKSDKILIHFDSKTKSPISLLELGLYASSEKLIVSCEDGFWRKGNIEIVCNKFNIPIFTHLSLAIEYLKQSL